MFVAGVMIIWCSFDVAGRDWVKLKKYQKSLKNQASVSISPQVIVCMATLVLNCRAIAERAPAEQQPVARRQGAEQGADGLQEVGQQPQQELEAPVR